MEKVTNIKQLETKSNNWGKVDCFLGVINKKFAKDLLERNLSTNRKPKNGAQKNYAHDIDAGNYMLSGETIIFNWNGELMDGQNRLLAFEKVKDDAATIEVIISTGIDPAAYKVIDSGVKRSTADMFGSKGNPNANIFAAIVRHLYAHYVKRNLWASFVGANDFTNMELEQWEENLSEDDKLLLKTTVSSVASWIKRANKEILNPARVGALCYIWSKHYKTVNVFNYFSTLANGYIDNGGGLSPNDNTSTLYFTVLSLKDYPEKRVHEVNAAMAATLVNGFHLWRRNKLVKSKKNLYFKLPESKNEPKNWPKIIE